MIFSLFILQLKVFKFLRNETVYKQKNIMFILVFFNEIFFN